MQFIMTARELQKYTIQKCVGFPKRYTFYVSQPIAACATRIHEDVKMANSIFPTISITLDMIGRSFSPIP